MESQTKESQIISSQTNQTYLLSNLPTKEGWSQPLVLYKNCWIRPQFLGDIMHLQNSFKARCDDTILVSNPKCGTTWLKALAFAITSRFRYDFKHHPLLSSHPQELVPYIEIVPKDKDLTYVETLPSPRILATHMPLSLLPKSILDSGCRIVYICREPKDAFVSRWHFENKIQLHQGKNSIDLEAAFNKFCEGVSAFGPFWDHCLGYWRQSIVKPDKVLFIKYEDMMCEPVKYVILLAEFLGVPFTELEHDHGIPKEVVRLCSFENLSGLHTNQNGVIPRRGNFAIEKSVFFRKGKVGDWMNHITQEMATKLNQIVEEKLKGSGLVL